MAPFWGANKTEAAKYSRNLAGEKAWRPAAAEIRSGSNDRLKISC